MKEVLIRTRELPRLSRDISLSAAKSLTSTEARPVPIPTEPRRPMSAAHDIPIQA